MKNILLIKILLLTFHLSFAQPGETAESIEPQVVRLYKEREEKAFTEEREVAFEIFDRVIHKLFQSRDICQYPLDSLSKCLSIRTSTDGKLRSFSWDDLGGGNYHYYTAFIQYELSDGSCKVVEIDTVSSGESANYLEVGYYKVEQMEQAGEVYYFLIGYGTYGGGRQHQAVKIFQIVDDELEECVTCYSEGIPLVIYYNRGQELQLRLSAKDQYLSFREYQFDEEIGFYTDKFEIVTIRFEGGKLVWGK